MNIISLKNRILVIIIFTKSYGFVSPSFQETKIRSCTILSSYIKSNTYAFCDHNLLTFQSILKLIQQFAMKDIIPNIKYLIILGLLMLGMHTVNGQEENNKKPYELDIPLLPILIDSALAKNKMLEYRRLEIDAKTYHAKSKAKNWTRYMGFQGGAQYGVFDNFSTSDQVNITTNDVNSSLLQWNFNIGVFLKIPIFGIINNKANNTIADVEIEQARSLHGSLIEEIIDDVIKLYEDLILRQELLEINAKNYANGRVNFEMIQKEFENGHISVTEYVRVSDVITKLTIEYEKSKSYFFQAKKLLENKVGFKIN